MEGLEEKWNNVGARRFATYTTLPPGDYVFYVRASNGDGVWNMDGQRVHVHIKPPFWKTRWFIAFALLSFLGLILAVYRVRVAGLKRRGRELERLVEQKTHELREMSLTEVLSTDIQAFILSEGASPKIHKTCSVGYSAFPLIDAEPDRYNFEQIMMLADQALYYAKAHGRNQAVRVLAGPARPETPEQAEKLLRNLEYGEQKGYIVKRVFRASGGESSGPETPG